VRERATAVRSPSSPGRGRRSGRLRRGAGGHMRASAVMRYALLLLARKAATGRVVSAVPPARRGHGYVRGRRRRPRNRLPVTRRGASRQDSLALFGVAGVGVWPSGRVSRASSSTQRNGAYGAQRSVEPRFGRVPSIGALSPEPGLRRAPSRRLLAAARPRRSRRGLPRTRERLGRPSTAGRMPLTARRPRPAFGVPQLREQTSGATATERAGA
jgi:hypothetical protein